VLVGEHVGGDRFRLIDLSVQRRGGGRAHFKRDPVAAARFVNAAIARGGGDATRVNYLGEWHSHPFLSASPSIKDVRQMQEIVEDPEGIATFSVLIVASARANGLEMSATLFRPQAGEERVEIHVPDGEAKGWRQVSSAPVEGSGDGNQEAPVEVKSHKENANGNASEQV